MRVGLTTSVIGHALVIAWGLVSLPSARPFPHEPVEALPVDILSDAEFTKLTKGSKKAELRPDPSPADKTEKKTAPEAENPGKHEVDKPSPKPEEKKVAALPPANQPPPPPKAVETPKPPEPKPAEPAPPVEKKVEPAPAPEKPAEPAPTAETAVEPLPADAPTPRSKPKPPKQEAAPKPAEQTAKPAPQTADAKKDFDPNDISALLNKVDPSGGGAKSGEKQASLGSPTGRAEKLTVGELDALRGQIARCWNPPVGAVGAEDLVVEIQMQLAEDGSLTGAPAVVNSSSNPFFRAAADAALRAVRRCAPYTLPAAKYETWKDVKVNFDPRQMMGGW